MKKLILIIIAIFSLQLNHSQNLSIESNLDGLILNIGDTFQAESYISDLDGNKTTCERLIYYQKDGAFNVGAAIDPTGLFVASDPGIFEIVAVCVGMEGGKRLSQTFLVGVKFPKASSIDFNIKGELYVGNFAEVNSVAKYADGKEKSDLNFKYESSDPAIIKVDDLGNLKAIKKGSSIISASFDGQTVSKKINVLNNPVVSIDLSSDSEGFIKTGDVINLSAQLKDKKGNILSGIEPKFSFSGVSTNKSTTASGLISEKGKFVADIAGEYVINASFGNTNSSIQVKAVNRDIQKEIVKLGLGEVFDRRTSDAWFFEGTDGKDYGVSGTWGSDGTAYFWDVSDPTDIKKIDSIQVDARIVNDVKVSKDGKLCVISREASSKRKNGIILIDVTDPSNAEIISEYTTNLTGGVHNIFIYENHVYALNAFANPAKYYVINIEDPKNPKEVGFFEVDEPGSAIHDVWIEDGIAYSSNWKQGVYLVDVGNGIAGGSPSNPVEIGNYRYDSGGNHAAFPFKSKSTGKFYVIMGDEIFPEGVDGNTFNETAGYLHFIDFTDLKNPVEVARYEVPGHGSHNYWVEDDVLYIGMYTAGVRVVDISGELMGDLYKQGREIAKYGTGHPDGYVPNSTMLWGAQYFKGNIFYSDFYTGIGALKLLDKKKDNSNTNQFASDQTLKEALGAEDLLDFFQILASPPIE